MGIATITEYVIEQLFVLQTVSRIRLRPGDRCG